MTPKECEARFGAPITRRVSATLELGQPLTLMCEPESRDGWWPVLDSVSWNVNYDPNVVWEELPNAIFFFYAYDSDQLSGATSPVLSYPDASLGILDPNLSLPLAVGRDATGVRRGWERYDVDIPARQDRGDVPCRLTLGFVLTSAGAAAGSPSPPWASARVVYHYRRVCGGSPC